MTDFAIEQTLDTPGVNFDVTQKMLSINGICTPENPRLFFEPILKKLKEFRDQHNELTININLDYLNSGSSKCVLDLLEEAGKNLKNKSLIKVKWYSEDEEVRDAGVTFEELSGLTFEYIGL